MSRKLLIIIVVVVMVSSITNIAHAQQVYLDSDTVTVRIGELAPGHYAKINMPYDVTFSSIHGDDENKDSEVKVGPVDIRVGLGNDDVKIWVMVNGEVEYDEELAHQHGFTWSQHVSGAAQVELIEDCYGTMKVLVNGKDVGVTVTGLTTTNSIDIMADKDATMLDSGVYYSCGATPPPDYHSSIGTNQKLLIAGIAVGSILGLLGLAMAMSRG